MIFSNDKNESCTRIVKGYVEKGIIAKSFKKSVCLTIQTNKWNVLKLLIDEDCDHCKNVNVYVNDQCVFSFKAHFHTRGFGGVLAENGFDIIAQFRKFNIDPIISN